MENMLNFTHVFFNKTASVRFVAYRALFTNPLQAAAKLSLVVVLFLVSVATTQAQKDLITTQAGEKIRCRILDETPTRFIYAYIGPNNKVLRNEIFKNLVSDFKYNYYPSDILIKGGQKLPDAGGSGKDGPAPRIDTRQTPSSSKSSSEPKRNTRNEKEAKKSEEKQEKALSETKSPENNKSDKKAAGNKDEDRVVDNKPAQKEEAASATKLGREEPKTEKKETVKTKTPEKKTEKSVEEDKKTVAPLATKPEKNDYANFMKLRVGAKGGLGNMLSKITTEDEYSLYREKLLRGYVWGADISYFLGEHIGIGATFNNFITQNKAENIDYIGLDGKSAKGNISNRISTKFVGPALLFRQSIDYKTFVVLSAAPGVYFYNDKAKFGETTVNIKGQDYGAAASLGLDFLLGNDISGRDIILSLEAGYNYGNMRSLNYGDGKGAVTLATPINLNRLDFTVGLRFTRYPKYLRN